MEELTPELGAGIYVSTQRQDAGRRRHMSGTGVGALPGMEDVLSSWSTGAGSMVGGRPRFGMHPIANRKGSLWVFETRCRVTGFGVQKAMSGRPGENELRRKENDEGKGQTQLSPFLPPEDMQIIPTGVTLLPGSSFGSFWESQTLLVKSAFQHPPHGT